MWTPQYDIIVETLTGSEFEMTVTDKDTVGYIKSRIQKYEGIPIGQQHLLYNHKELSDTTEMKDIPLANGSRLKLVLDMKGGPVSARRVVSLPDYDNWFDLSDVLNTSRHDPLTITTPGVKLLFYKDCKKNVHRIMKLRSDRKSQNATKTNNDNSTFTSDNDEQWVKENLQTIQKMHQLQMKLEQKRKNKEGKKQKAYVNDNNVGGNNNANSNKNAEQINLLCENFKKKSSLIIGSSEIKNSNVNVNKITKLLSEQHQHQNQRKSSSFEFPVPILSKRSLSSGLLNKYGLNKTCIRPPSYVSQQQQHQQQLQINQKQQKIENSFFPLHALSPLSLPSPGMILSPSKFGKDFKSQTSIESGNKDKDGFNSNPAILAIKRPVKQLTKVIPSSPLSSVTNIKNQDFDCKSKMRENIRRNRSFKAINKSLLTTTAAIVPTISPNSLSDDDLIKHSQLSFNTPINNRSLSSMIDKIFGNNSDKIFERRNTSESVQDLIEKIAVTSKMTTNKTTNEASSLIDNSSNKEINDLSKITETNDDKIGIEGRIRLPKLSSTGIPAVAAVANNSVTGGPFESTVFVDRHHQHHNSLGINAIDKSSSCVGADFNLEAATATSATTTSALDNGSPFRLYKMSSTDAKNSYELPKLLIREDSPVESFHSSDPQLETLTIRGESPKSVIAETSFSKLSTTETAAATLTASTDPGSTTTGTTLASTTSKTIIKTPWNHHHHSDLGLNNLELNFLNEEYSDLDSKLGITDNCDLTDSSVLKIASNLEISSNCWNSTSFELDGQSQPSTTSLNFINGDLTSSDEDEDDEDEEEENLFSNTNTAGGSCCMLHNNTKSKSIELNDFRMMFGSSPTLLNSTNYHSVTHTSRLDAVPIQYRRGYTNLNDACLSSSTSDLELFNGSGSSNTGSNVRNKNSSKSASQELPSAFTSRHHLHHHHLHHHHHHHRHKITNSSSSNSLDFVRSYENLDRAKILRMKNEQYQHQQCHQQHINRNSSLLTKGGLKHFWDGVSSSADRFGGSNKRLQRNFSREKLQEEDFYIDDDIDFSFANLGYENALITTVSGTNNCSSSIVGGGSASSSGANNNNNSNMNSVGSRTSDFLPLATGFPSDESLFNMNLDHFTDEFNLLSTISFNNEIGGSGINSGINCDGNIGNCSGNNDCLLLSPMSPLNQSNENDDGNKNNDNMDNLKVDGKRKINVIGEQNSLTTEFDIDEKIATKKIIPSIIKKTMRLQQLSIKDVKNVDIKSEGLSKHRNINSKIEIDTTANVLELKAPRKPEKLRCAECNKKLGLIMIMKCHCQKIFCPQHRYAEAHNCSYNFKSEGKKILSRENPLVVAQKITKI